MRKTSLQANSWKQRGVCLALAASLLTAGAAQAQDIRVSTTAARPAEAPALDMKDNTVQLSLKQAVEIALQQNLGIVVERYTRTQRRLGITQSLGLYDLVAQSTLSASDEQRAVVSTTEAGSSNQQVFDFSFRQRI